MRFAGALPDVVQANRSMKNRITKTGTFADQGCVFF